MLDAGAVLTWRADGSTGRPRCSPVRPGVTPPTILVPHAKDSLAFAVALKISNHVSLDVHRRYHEGTAA